MSMAGISVKQSPTCRSNQFFVCGGARGVVTWSRATVVDVVATAELVADHRNRRSAQDDSKASAAQRRARAAALLLGRILEKLRGDLLRIVVVVGVAGEALDDQVGDHAHRVLASAR